MEVGKKPEPGKKFSRKDHNCAHISDLVLEESSVGKFSPWINFAKLAEITLEF